MRNHDKSIFALSLLLLALTVGLAGCDWFASLFDPLVGVWDIVDSSSSGMSGSLDMHGDKTFSLSLTQSSVENTSSSSDCQGARFHSKHEPRGRLLGQRVRGNVFQDLESRVDSGQDLPTQGGGQGRDI